LRHALSMNHSLNNQWSETQAQKLFNARSNFRKALREDLGNLYIYDENDENTEKYWESL